DVTHVVPSEIAGHPLARTAGRTGSLGDCRLERFHRRPFEVRATRDGKHRWPSIRGRRQRNTTSGSPPPHSTSACLLSGPGPPAERNSPDVVDSAEIDRRAVVVEPEAAPFADAQLVAEHD